MQITVPPEDRVIRASDDMAVLTSADGEGGGGAVRMNSETRLVNEHSGDSGSNRNAGALAPLAPEAPPQAYNVVIPRNTRPGATFPVSVNGKLSYLIFYAIIVRPALKYMKSY